MWAHAYICMHVNTYAFTNHAYASICVHIMHTHACIYIQGGAEMGSGGLLMGSSELQKCKSTAHTHK